MKRKTVSGVMLALLLLISMLYAVLVPSITASEIGRIDATTSYEGTLDYFGMHACPKSNEAQRSQKGIRHS